MPTREALRCSVCKEYKSPEEFHKNSRTKRGRVYKCKPCLKIGHKWVMIKHNYGLTFVEYMAMMQDQDGACAMSFCDKFATHVDHCHDTGRVRGLLCSGHNTGLGAFADNIEYLEEALEYLRRSR